MRRSGLLSFIFIVIIAASAQAQNCMICHGSGQDPAPPEDTLGNTDTSATGVGFHQSHQGTSSWHAEIACEECHIVPAGVTDDGHMDTELPAEITWGATATAGGATPAWDGANCTVYCHGSTLYDGGATPSWTVSDGSSNDCGACHGMPPAAPHVVNTACHLCHPGIDAAQEITDADSHIDGVTQTYPMDCTTCHGSGDDSAPPMDTAGNTSTTETGVGFHQSHQGTSSWHAEVTCDECHLVPVATDDAGHIDTALPAELVWGPIASADGATPTWNGANCTVYCHGSTLDDGGATPSWTVSDGSSNDCGACHGMPPADPHTADTDCHRCHPGIDESGTITDASSHIDGVLQVEITAVHDGPPAATILRDAVPNPFNPSTTLSFTTSRARHVRLSIFDAEGRLVTTLVDEYRSAGDHHVAWDGRSDRGRRAPSGVYLYRLETKGFSESRRMVLVK